MFRSTCSPIRVQWDKQRFTKDGRPRARRPLWGIHRTKWSERLPWPIVTVFGCASAWTVYRFYSQISSLTPTQKFLSKVSIVPHGVLGTQLHDTGSLLFVADSPDYNTAITDPAGLHHIHGVADGAGGAAGAIYKWLNIRGPFADEVKLAISTIGDAKLHKYPLPEAAAKEQAEKLLEQAKKIEQEIKAKMQSQGQQEQAATTSTHTGQQQQEQSNSNNQDLAPLPPPGSSLEYVAAQAELDRKQGKDPIAERLNTRSVIHVVGPDFRVGKWTDREASLALARGYRNVLHEWVRSGCDTLRIAPVSSGIFSGPLYNQMPILTQEAMAQGFEQLHQFDKDAVLEPNKKIELCIFQLREWDSYCNAFDFVAPPIKASAAK